MKAKSPPPDQSPGSRARPAGLQVSGPRGGARAARIRLLIADDHAVVREGLAALINRQPDMKVVAEAGDGRQAVDLWKQHRPDVTLLDLRMPELDGVRVIEEIRAQHNDARVVLLTTFDSDEDVYRGMKAGAKAYLLKDARREELLECIRKVQAGETFVPPAIAAKLAERISEAELTHRETEVLVLLAGGMTNKEIGQALSISETTVKSHMKSLFSKLNVMSRTEAVSVAGHRGLIRL
jgi:DNA-binding NarL/FixJ family response regulator